MTISAYSNFIPLATQSTILITARFYAISILSFPTLHLDWYQRPATYVMTAATDSPLRHITSWCASYVMSAARLIFASARRHTKRVIPSRAPWQPPPTSAANAGGRGSPKLSAQGHLGSAHARAKAEIYSFMSTATSSPLPPAATTRG